MEMVTKTFKLSGGILKWLSMLLSKVVPCLMKRVCVCAIIVFGMKVHIRIGIIRSICFVSSTSVTSTSVTEHNLHGPPESLLIAALFRNLHII